MRRRLLKSLRITITTGSLLVCAALIVLWVRSYYRPEGGFGPVFKPTRLVVGAWFFGMFQAGIWDTPPQHGRDFWEFRAIPETSFHELQHIKKWELSSSGRHLVKVRFPCWFLVTIFSVVAALPWIKWRFSLRTLLVVLTLFAVFFGAIAMSL